VDVYSGKLTDWRELGGDSGPIRAIGREPTDASRQAITRVIKPFENIEYGENVKVVHLDPELIALLDRFPTSFGVLNQSALGACNSKIVHLALDGVEPTAENLEKGLYPAWLELGLIYKPDALTPAGKAFLEFVRSPAGERIARWRTYLARTRHFAHRLQQLTGLDRRAARYGGNRILSERVLGR